MRVKIFTRKNLQRNFLTYQIYESLRNHLIFRKEKRIILTVENRKSPYLLSPWCVAQAHRQNEKKKEREIFHIPIKPSRLLFNGNIHQKGTVTTIHKRFAGNTFKYCENVNTHKQTHAYYRYGLVCARARVRARARECACIILYNK